MNDENPKESQQSGYDNNPPTGGLPTFEPPPPGSTYPAQPQWFAPAPPVVRWRFRDHLTVAIIVAVVMIVVVGLGITWVSKVTVRTTAEQTSLPAGNSAQQHPNQAAAANGLDLTKGAVFSASDNADANTVTAFARAADGTLHKIGTYPTGGRGSGSFEDVAQSLVVASTEGTVSPLQVTSDPKFVIVPNIGSGTITVFRIKPHGLELASTTVSGGLKPVSIAVSHGLLYVLNSGEVTNQFLTGPTSAIENCTTGQLPSVTGFHIDDSGKLTEIPGSTRLLSGDAESGCTMIAFTPDGNYLFAAERLAGKLDPQTGFHEGELDSFPVRPDGTLDQPTITTPTGDGIYSLLFSKDGRTMLTTDQGGELANPNGGLVTSYSVTDGNVTPNGNAVRDERTDTCWAVLTKDESLLFVSSFFGDHMQSGSISSFQVSKGGSIKLLYPDATADDGHTAAANHLNLGVADLALSSDSQYLYTVSTLSGDVWSFKVNPNGTLTYVQKIHTYDVTPLNQGGQGGPTGIAAY